MLNMIRKKISDYVSYYGFAPNTLLVGGRTGSELMLEIRKIAPSMIPNSTFHGAVVHGLTVICVTETDYLEVCRV